MREYRNLNTGWAFSKEAESVPETMPKDWDRVDLPHCWNAVDGQDGGDDYYRGTCYYAKELFRSDLPRNQQYYLELQGANSSADVYVNGKKLAHHDGGYSAWRVNLTDSLTEKNLLVIAVDNSKNRRVYPQLADFTFYGGIYRSISLIAVEESHFDLDCFGGPGIKVTPVISGDGAEVETEVFLTNVKPGQTLTFTIKDREGNTVAEECKAVTETVSTLRIPGVHLWNGRKDPYLYTAEVVLQEQEETLDMVTARFGCRSYEIDPERGFILNGESYPLRGVSRHQDRWGLGNALLLEHHREDMDLICELGANTIRLAHYQHDRYFYDLCDERGMIVWAEIPYITEHMPEGRENTISQMKELIYQNYNHPSIVVWGLSNEITMTGGTTEDLLENHRLLNEMVHEMDKTRLTAMAVVSMCDIHDPYIQIPDTVAYNHYFGWYGGSTEMNGPWFDRFHREFPDLPIGVSEYGCEGLNWHTSDPRVGDYTEEYQAYYHEELIKQLYTRPYLWATYVWNMFDFGADARNEGGENGQNHKGLVTFDRKYKKDAFYAYKAWLSDEPFVHICGKRYVDRVEEITRVTVYSNLPRVELFVNGKSLGKQESAEHFFYFRVPNQGESTLLAVAGECRDESRIRKVEQFNEAYRLKEEGAVLNWVDITEPEGCFSLNDRIEDILGSEEGKKLFQKLLKDLSGRRPKEAVEEETGFVLDDSKLKMLESFTVLRMLGMLGTVGLEPLTKEEMLEINDDLNRIRK